VSQRVRDGTSRGREQSAEKQQIDVRRSSQKEYSPLRESYAIQNRQSFAQHQSSTSHHQTSTQQREWVDQSEQKHPAR